ncbi:MAG: hypothetical protein ACI37Z_05040 [Candidatus Gastranaerophilaceae bacterium]
MYQLKFLINEIDYEYNTEEDVAAIAKFKTLSEKDAKKTLYSVLKKADIIMNRSGEYYTSSIENVKQLKEELFEDFNINITEKLTEKCLNLRLNNGSNSYTFLKIAELIQSEISFVILNDDCDFVYHLEV